MLVHACLSCSVPCTLQLIFASVGLGLLCRLPRATVTMYNLHFVTRQDPACHGGGVYFILHTVLSCSAGPRATEMMCPLSSSTTVQTQSYSIRSKEEEIIHYNGVYNSVVYRTLQHPVKRRERPVVTIVRTYIHMHTCMHMHTYGHGACTLAHACASRIHDTNILCYAHICTCTSIHPHIHTCTYVNRHAHMQK